MNTLTYEQERDLVLAASKDINDFKHLYEQYKNRIFRYIRFRVSTIEEAEDLTSQTFLQAIERFRSYRDTGVRFGAWLYTIAQHLVIDWYRKRKPLPLPESEDDLPSHNPAPALNHALDMETLGAHLLSCINQLKKKEQQIVILKSFEETTFKEIATTLGKSESGIKMSYYRSLKKLSKLL